MLNKVGTMPKILLSINTPPNLNVFTTLSFYNSVGSVKDKVPFFSYLLNKEVAKEETTIVGSSFGSLSVAIGVYSKK